MWLLSYIADDLATNEDTESKNGLIWILLESAATAYLTSRVQTCYTACAEGDTSADGSMEVVPSCHYLILRPRHIMDRSSRNKGGKKKKKKGGKKERVRENNKKGEGNTALTNLYCGKLVSLVN